MTLYHPGHSIMTDSKEDGLPMDERGFIHIQDLGHWLGCPPGMHIHKFLHHVRDRYRDALSASSPPVGGLGEVVAYRSRWADDPDWHLSLEPRLVRDEDGEHFIQQPLYAAPVPNGVPEGWLPTYGSLPWDQLGRDVIEAKRGDRDPFDFGNTYPGHVMTGINFNSLSRIVDKYRLAASPVTPEGLSGGGETIRARVKPEIIAALREWAEFEQDGGNVEQGAAIDAILDWYDAATNTA